MTILNLFKEMEEPKDEVVHDIEDDYKEYEDNIDQIYENEETNDKSHEVVIEELDSSDPFEYDDSSVKKNEYIQKRNKRISSHKNKNFSQDTHEQKLAIPAYKRKNINLDNESSENDQSKTLDFTEED